MWFFAGQGGVGMAGTSQSAIQLTLVCYKSIIVILMVIQYSIMVIIFQPKG